ncbi:chemotaxis protein CheW [Colwellia piezophila]|uniref:chemotaxis protein CheW n=1 Tax=Colwellia piezophila TaxID=211668 RepID=UPI00037EE0EA|nr:chemotaxis protein CheW [Colwellia piezophila]
MSEESKNICQYLTFQQNKEVFGIDIRYIKEVLEIREITSIPRSSEFMRGVINLRGQVVPVIDLKLKFGLEKTDFTVDTCIIILELKIAEELCLFGALADSVREVIDLDEDSIAPPPKIGSNVDTAFIYGVGKFEDNFVVILDALKLCTYEEMDVIHDIAESELVGEQLPIEQSTIE